MGMVRQIDPGTEVIINRQTTRPGQRAIVVEQDEDLFILTTDGKNRIGAARVDFRIPRKKGSDRSR